MTRNSTHNDWWRSHQGIVRTKAVITLADETEIEVYSSDYIKSWKVTQDLSSGNDRPVFDFVSDMLELTLYSLDNDFNPFAESSQYYGKFILGVKIDLFTKIDYLGAGDELNWDKIGRFKIADIQPSPTGTEAYILAYDYGYAGIENSKQLALSPLRYIDATSDVKAFLEDVYPEYEILLQSELTVDDMNAHFAGKTINQVLLEIGSSEIKDLLEYNWDGTSFLPKRLFPLENKLVTMNELLSALGCFSRCDGYQIKISPLNNALKAGIDEDVIVALTPEQSLVQQFDKSAVSWNEIGLEQGREIVALTAEFDAPGEKVYGNVSFDAYVNKLEETVCNSTDSSDITDVNISNVFSNVLTLKATNAKAGEVAIKVKAEVITTNEILEGELNNIEDIYELKNKYIQSKEHAEAVKAKLDQFITTKNKYCGAEIIFNPLLRLSDLVECKHEDYGVDIEAYIVEQTLEVSSEAPAGRQSLVLLNREAVL